MSDIVYVITTGCYSDYTIQGVTTNITVAEEYAKYFKDGHVKKYCSLTEDDLNTLFKIKYYHLDRFKETIYDEDIILNQKLKHTINLYFNKDTSKYLGYEISLWIQYKDNPEIIIDKEKNQALNVLNTIKKYLVQNFDLEVIKEYIDSKYDIVPYYVEYRKFENVEVGIGPYWKNVVVTLNNKSMQRLTKASSKEGWVETIDGDIIYGDVSITIPNYKSYINDTL